MSLSTSLDLLADKAVYASGAVAVRWGQLLRANAALSDEFARLANKEAVVAMGSFGRLHSGVVPRANAYFIVSYH
jgi:hypothetical protein